MYGSNTFGKAFSVTTFGESHGAGIGVVIDGCPSNIDFDLNWIQQDLERRKPGQSHITTARQETDKPEILSGVFEGKTLGSPIALFVANTDSKPADYQNLKDTYRPSHADYTYAVKYGHRDFRGGGRQSARETLARVMAGTVAKMLLKKLGVSVHAWVSAIHEIELTSNNELPDFSLIDSNLVRCPDDAVAQKMILAVEKAKAEGDSLGGIISCVALGVPAGWGEPVFDKLHADLGKAMLSINAVKGFEIGEGFKATRMKGSEHNDAFKIENNSVRTETNHSGGIQGGISNGEEIFFRVAFKPVASIGITQDTINSSHENVKITVTGRHDPCVVPRAVPIVEAMAAITLADHYLRSLKG